MGDVMSNAMQVLAYIVGPVLLGVVIYYGIRRSGKSRRDAVRDGATKKVYAENEIDREAQATAAQRSSKLIDRIERKTGTTG
jgi:hypothetical protein